MPPTQTPARPSRPLRFATLAVALWCACVAVHAQTLPDGVDASRISPQFTLKLIDMLVKKGLMTRAEADDMIRDAAASTPAAATTADAASGASGAKASKKSKKKKAASDAAAN